MEALVILGAAACATVLVLGGFGGALWLGLRALGARHRRLVALPVRPIAELVPGPARVKVRGRVVPLGDLVRDPLEAEPCVAYEFDVKAKSEPSGSGARRAWSWNRVAGAAQTGDFALDDGTGLVRIVGPVALIGLREDPETDDPRLHPFARAQLPALREGATLAGVRKLLRAGVEVRAVGRVAAEPDAPSSAYRDRAPRLRLVASEDGEVLVGDRDDWFGP
ncbi:MAG TPA: hypothetical protein RMH99_27210 [Sandaracinaceae bacterium LLY-WYZ-13_1]|nr:hypothetical protein [Sandaracinaceae bacterium LLY-WYZ-13_1]